MFPALPAHHHTQFPYPHLNHLLTQQHLMHLGVNNLVQQHHGMVNNAGNNANGNHGHRNTSMENSIGNSMNTSMNTSGYHTLNTTSLNDHKNGSGKFFLSYDAE